MVAGMCVTGVMDILDEEVAISKAEWRRAAKSSAARIHSQLAPPTRSRQRPIRVSHKPSFKTTTGSRISSRMNKCELRHQHESTLGQAWRRSQGSLINEPFDWRGDSHCRSDVPPCSASNKDMSTENVFLGGGTRSDFGSKSAADLIEGVVFDGNGSPLASIETLPAILEPASTELSNVRGVDVAVQCYPEEMLEPMAPHQFQQRCHMRKLYQASISCDPRCSYSVASHFSNFEDIHTIVTWVLDLDDSDRRGLANRFLGREICGIPASQSGNRPRRIADRYVAEVALIAQASSVFREAICASARRLFLDGFVEYPFNGRGVLLLACERPEQWGSLAHTAVDLAARLVRAGALRVAFAHELRSTAVAAAVRDHGCGLAWGWVDLLSNLDSRRLAQSITTSVVRSSSLRTQCGQHDLKISHNSKTSFQQKAEVARCCALSDEPLGNSPVLAIRGLPRTQSAPASLPSSCGRCRGTLLRLQDEAQPYCCVSVTSEVTVIPIVIQGRFRADYWRFAVGGDHSRKTLEVRARVAEIAYSQHLTQSILSQPQLMQCIRKWCATEEIYSIVLQYLAVTSNVAARDRL